MKAQVRAVVLMMAVTATLGNISANMEQECPILISTGDEGLSQLVFLRRSATAGMLQAIASKDYAEWERLYSVFLKVGDEVHALQAAAEYCKAWADEVLRVSLALPLATPEVMEAYNSPDRALNQ